MPKIDGLTATRQLREEGYRGPIIALTAHMIGGHLEECIAAGCEGCLGKPFERKALVRILSLFLMKGDAPKSLTGSPFAANANEFKRNFDGNLDALEATRAQGDLASLKILAHRLAGAAAFAYREIYDSLAALETAAQEQRCEDCELLITSLKDIHRTKGARYSAERRGPYIAP